MQQDIPAIKFTVSSGWHQLDDLDLRISLNETNLLLLQQMRQRLLHPFQESLQLKCIHAIFDKIQGKNLAKLDKIQGKNHLGR